MGIVTHSSQDEIPQGGVVRSRLDPEDLLNVVKTISIVVGGCWIAWRYFAHERESTKLATEQQRLALRQSQVVAEFERISAEQRARQLTLGNEQSRLALQVQQSSQQYQLEAQRLGNEQARLALSIQESQRTLRQHELETSVMLQQSDIELKRLEQKKAGHDVEYATAGRFSREFSISAERLDSFGGTLPEFEVKHGLTFQNISQVDIEISVLIIDYYIGVQAAQVEDRPTIVPLGVPADRWNYGSEQSGRIKWTHIGGIGSILGDAVPDIGPMMYFDDVKLVPGGPGTGFMKPDQRQVYTDTYIVKAPADAWVLFVTSYCFNRCKRSEDMHSYTNWVSLRRAVAGKGPVAGE